MVDPGTPDGPPGAGLAPHAPAHTLSSLHIVTGYLRHRVPFDSACYRTLSADQAWLTLQAEYPPGKKSHRGMAIPVEGSANGEAIRQGKPVVSGNLAKKPSYHEDLPDAGAGFRSRVCVPVSLYGRPVGALELLSEKEGGFPGDAVEDLARASERLGLAFSHEHAARRVHELEKQVGAAGTAEHSDASLHSVMRAHITNALERCRGRVYGEDGAARLLGIKPGTLAARMKRLGIDSRSFGADGAIRPATAKGGAGAAPELRVKTPGGKEKASKKEPPAGRSKKSPTTPAFAPGSRVRVLPGVAFPTFPDVSMEGWTGFVKTSKGTSYLVEFDSEGLGGQPELFGGRCEKANVRGDAAWVEQAGLARAPRNAKMEAEAAQIDRLRALFRTPVEYSIPFVSEETLRVYYEFLARRISFPFGAEYEEISGKEEGKRFGIRVSRLVAPERGDTEAGVGVEMLRDDGKSGIIPLAWVEIPSKTGNWPLLDDYGYWFYTWNQ